MYYKILIMLVNVLIINMLLVSITKGEKLSGSTVEKRLSKFKESICDYKNVCFQSALVNLLTFQISFILIG